MDIKNKRIMKKEYIKPEMVVEEILLESMMMSNSQTVNPGGPGKPPRSNERRGDWGNLWEQDEN